MRAYLGTPGPSTKPKKGAEPISGPEADNVVPFFRKRSKEFNLYEEELREAFNSLKEIEQPDLLHLIIEDKIIIYCDLIFLQIRRKTESDTYEKVREVEVQENLYEVSMALVESGEACTKLAQARVTNFLTDLEGGRRPVITKDLADKLHTHALGMQLLQKGYGRWLRQLKVMPSLPSPEPPLN